MRCVKAGTAYGVYRQDAKDAKNGGRLANGSAGLFVSVTVDVCGDMTVVR
jgi:hypothetical protein